MTVNAAPEPQEQEHEDDAADVAETLTHDPTWVPNEVV
jgi:hypothetical protein